MRINNTFTVDSFRIVAAVLYTTVTSLDIVCIAVPRQTSCDRGAKSSPLVALRGIRICMQALGGTVTASHDTFGKRGDGRNRAGVQWRFKTGMPERGEEGEGSWIDASEDEELDKR
jgi:hypothetical protein